MSREYPTPDPEDVVAALEQTGFMFEQRVARLLGSDVSTGWAFEDPDSAASREIDLYVSRSTTTRVDGRELIFGWTLLGECKDYRTPWVALTADYHPDGEEAPHSEIYMTNAVRDKLGATGEDGLFGNLTAFDSVYSRARLHRAPRAVQLLTMRRKGTDWATHGGDIYNSVTYPLAKAITVLTNRRADNVARAHMLPRDIHFFFPVLIVSAPIYSVSLAENGSPVVREVDHVTLERVLASERVQGKFRIDVLSFDAVPRWRTEFIPAVLKEFAERLEIEKIDPGFIPSLTRLHVPTLDEHVAALEGGHGYSDDFLPDGNE